MPKMKTYKSTATYKRINPKTGVVESTSRFIKGIYPNQTEAEAELMRQVKLDDVVGKISISTKRYERLQ